MKNNVKKRRPNDTDRATDILFLYLYIGIFINYILNISNYNFYSSILIMMK